MIGVLPSATHIAAPSIDWNLPFTIQVWKGKTKEGQGAAETAILFRQSGDTLKWFFTRDHLNGMPDATQDTDTKEWDFRAQQACPLCLLATSSGAESLRAWWAQRP